MSALSKEEGQIRESLERIDQKLKGQSDSFMLACHASSFISSTSVIKVMKYTICE